MDYYTLEALLKNNPTVQLLRRDKYAPLVISFVMRAFKGEEPRMVIHHNDLQLELAQFLDEIAWKDDLALEDGMTAFDQKRATAKQYLREWSDARYLRQYPNPDGQDVLELTPASELVIQWAEDLQPKEFIGTESRFQDIMDRMDRLVSKSETDPEKRKKDLQDQIAALKLELKNIEDSDLEFIRSTYTQNQVWERYLELTKDAKDLLADFRQVEQNFRQVAEDLYTRQLEAYESRGRLLGVALDARQEMEESPQGKSFRAFWNYLRQRQPNKQSLEELAEKLFGLMHEQDLEPNDGFLQDLKHYLTQAGEQVLKSNRAMVERLRRTLSEEAMAERQRLGEGLDAVKKLALACAQLPPPSENFYLLETGPEVLMPMDRPLGKADENERRFNQPQALESTMEGVELEQLFEEDWVDRTMLRKRIDKLLETRETVALQTLLESHPLEQGLAELLSYFALASQDEDAMIWDTRILKVALPDQGRSLKVPEIIFRRHQKNPHD